MSSLIKMLMTKDKKFQIITEKENEFGKAFVKYIPIQQRNVLGLNASEYLVADSDSDLDSDDFKSAFKAPSSVANIEEANGIAPADDYIQVEHSPGLSNITFQMFSFNKRETKKNLEKTQDHGFISADGPSIISMESDDSSFQALLMEIQQEDAKLRTQMVIGFTGILFVFLIVCLCVLVILGTWLLS